MAEYVHWVDSNNRVKGKITRKEAHDRLLLHRVVHIIVLNKKQEMFLQRRSRKFKINPGLWTGSVAGHVDYGESYHTTALRELREEIGVRAKKVKFLFNYKLNDSGCNKIAKLYILENFSGKPKIDHNEVIAGKWMPMDKIEKILETNPEKFTLSFRKVFKIYLRL